tara:strand:+ start:3949 stop:4524 length:576 start_codon:yes stop_codon:yes gene_type:complete
MPFWTSALSEPKRAHRFILDLPNIAAAEDKFTYRTYLAKSVTKPAYTVGQATHKFLGNTFYYPGSVEWNELSAVIVNSINPDGNALFMNALANMGYLRPDIQEDVILANRPPGTPNKKDALNALGLVNIRELNGEGGLVGEWQLVNAWITTATFGDLSYDNDTELLNVTVGMRYDYALYSSGPAVDFAAEP